jgi:hypothetical protein
MPCAPAGLTTPGLKPLSCQIRLAKNGTGRSLARAAEATALHTLARDIAGAGSMRTAAGASCGASKAEASPPPGIAALTSL